MGKKIGIAAVVLVVIAGIAAAVVLKRIDRIVESEIESTGPRLTGTDVDLGGAHISIFSGEGALSDLSIGNPEGFSGDDAFELGKIKVAVDLKSLAGDVVHVRSVVVDGPELLAEFDPAGKSNLRTIMDHVKRAAGAGGGGAKGESGGSRRRIVIDEFRFENAQLHALAPAFDLDKTLQLPPIVLKNVGGKGGATPAELGQQILRPIIDTAVSAAMKETVAAQRQKLGEKAEEQLMEKIFK